MDIKKKHITYSSESKSLGTNVKAELDLSNYATKADLKNATSADTLPFTKKTDLSNLKSNVDKLHIDKLKNVPSCLINLKSRVDKVDIIKLGAATIDLSKLSDIVKNGVVKKTEYNVLVKKGNNINTTDTSNLFE